MLDKKITIKIGGSFDPVPMGVYTVQLVDVNSITQFNSFKGKEEDMLNYQMAILDDNKSEDGSSTRDRYLWKRCSMSLNEKAWLFKIVRAIYGRELNNEELTTFDPESIIGKQVKVMVEQKPDKDGTTIWNNILSFSHVDKELTPVEFTAKPSTIEKTSKPIQVEEEADPDKVIAELEANK